ncbi:MAG: TrmH family RNA methyltransferase [Planctomycetota bacterium]
MTGASGLVTDNLACVLVRPEHAGNVGAAARALGNLGLADLRLVGDLELGAEARAMACTFQQILAEVRRHASLTPALADCVLAVAMVSPMRHRDVPAQDLRTLTPRIAAASQLGKVALVFGSEQSGLVHDDVARCTVAASLCLPSSRPTLNLAQAVLLAAYELRRVEPTPTAEPVGGREPPATLAETAGILAACSALLTRLGYGDERTSLHARIHGRCRALAHRAALSHADVQMLHGLLTRLDPT